ncbi:RNA polymerase sigma factor [Polyangium mundeleinium]|uniref:Sigma-70 family RNA polymerase sigma factor n=1 Tax=Polyangium mundeleinium TaxID=2995306 RepID=A0ABT5EWC6_9BACT|nr:sigma-70 family RNA polymerase sigma factor [Polyangium mundeleinium]MDC0746106.1 sigma-70 family RNA polymerase sigma factor [Polyangium mundeleinium]
MDGVFRMFRWFPWAARGGAPSAVEHPLDVVAVHAEYADFVFRSLQRLGVRPPDLDDLRQEVFIVVHKRLHTFDTGGSMQAWLFGICKNIVARHRQRAYVRRETTAIPLPETSSEGVQPSPEENLATKQARAELTELLNELELERCAVLVMFEIEQKGCEDIAKELGVPVGTVHSRLHAARKEFEKALARREARLSRGRRR